MFTLHDENISIRFFYTKETANCIADHR